MNFNCKKQKCALSQSTFNNLQNSPAKDNCCHLGDVWLSVWHLTVISHAVLNSWSNIEPIGSCSSLIKSLKSTLKVSIQKQKEQSWRYNHGSTTIHPPPPTHNFLILVEGWFSLFFSSQTITKDIFYLPFPIFKTPKLLMTGDPA